MKFAALVLVLILGSWSTTATGQVLDNAEEAFRLSAESQKPVLLIFSGSDWCAPCIRFQKNVLSTEQFQHYASDHLILLKADFPQRKQLDKNLVLQNEGLAEKYNPRGQFPQILLLRPDQTILTTLHYRNEQSETFIAQLSTHFAE